MFLSARELEIRPLRFDISYPVGEFEFDQPGSKGGVRQGEPINVVGTAELESTIGDIRVSGHVKAVLVTECVKCLEKASIPVDSDFDLVYLPEGTEPEGGEVQINEKEAEVGFYQGHGLELRSVVEEILLLAVPMRPVCKEECRGLCPVCGANRNEAECNCQTPVMDARWSGLDALKAKDATKAK